MNTLRVHIAELAISDDSAATDGIAAEVVSNRTTAAGHTIVGRSVVGNDEAVLRAQLVAWIADPNIDVVIAISTDANRWLAALAPLGAPKALAGPAQVEGAHFIRCKTTSVFIVPGATSAVIEAMDNVVAEMSRLVAESSSAAPAAVPPVAAVDNATVSRRRTQPPPPPADKRVSTPPPLPAREDVVSTSEIVAIADAPPPPLACEDVVSTSEIVAIADAPAPSRRTTPPPLPRAVDDDQPVAGAVLLAPRRSRMQLGRWIAIALLAGASGFGVTAWILRDSGGPSMKSTTGELADPAHSTAVAIAPSEGPEGVDPNAPIPEVVVDVSGSSGPPKPTNVQPTQSTPPNSSVTDPAPANRGIENAGSAGVRGSIDKACSEEACALDPAQPCCERYKPRTADDKPNALARWMVKAGVEQLKPRVVACGEKNSAKGTVRVAVKVEPDGSVAEAVVAESPNAELGRCVEAALRSGKFAKTATGGTFRYPFVF